MKASTTPTNKFEFYLTIPQQNHSIIVDPITFNKCIYFDMCGLIDIHHRYYLKLNNYCILFKLFIVICTQNIVNVIQCL